MPAVSPPHWPPPKVSPQRETKRLRGLRLCLFSIEEWGLLGSHAYVADLDDAARGAIALNVNLDSVAGAGGLAALWSGFPALAAFLGDVSAASGIPLALHAPLVRNSDHYNFAVAGGSGLPSHGRLRHAKLEYAPRANGRGHDRQGEPPRTSPSR